MPSDEDGEKAPNRSIGETLEKQTACTACDVIQVVSGMESVPGEQVPRLNAALLSMIQGVQDATNTQGMAESRVLEPLETLRDGPPTHPLCSTSRILCSHMGVRHITRETLWYTVPHATVPWAPQLRA